MFITHIASMRIFSVYQWIIAAPIIVVLTILTAIVTAVGSMLFGGRLWGYYPPHFWAKCWCWLLFVRVKVLGRENVDKNVSYVFVANHQGAYDIFSIYGFLGHNFKWMMKKSLEKVPFVGFACRCAGHIMVDRSSAAAIKLTMSTAKSRLRNGVSLVVFPEGTRSHTGKMGTFKRGAFKLASEFNLPIVPITINGSYDVLPRTTYQIRPGRITITLHKPIPPERGLDDAMSTCFESIRSALDEKYK